MIPIFEIAQAQFLARVRHEARGEPTGETCTANDELPDPQPAGHPSPS